MVGFGTARLGEWRLNHIYSINGVEVSCLDSSAEMDYKLYAKYFTQLPIFDQVTN